MSDIETKIRKWGNSYGIIIPLEVVRSKGLKEGEKVGAIIVKKGNILRESFGTHKFSKPIARLMKEIDKEMYDI